MKLNKEDHQQYVLNKLIEGTEVIYTPKLDYSDSWFYIHYPFSARASVYIGETFEHPFSFPRFESYVQDKYGILEDEISSLWLQYRKYIRKLSQDIVKKGPNHIDLVI